MTVALEVRIGDLLTKFLADALVFLSALEAAGAITTGTLQALPNGCNHFFIIVESDSHFKHFPSQLLYSLCQVQIHSSLF